MLVIEENRVFLAFVKYMLAFQHCQQISTVIC